MEEIISNNPDLWPEIISNNYGIILDEHFWENSPLLSFETTGEGLFPLRTGLDGITGLWYREPAYYGRVRGKSGGALDIHKAILKVAPRKNEADRKMVKALDAIPWLWLEQ